MWTPPDRSGGVASRGLAIDRKPYEARSHRDPRRRAGVSAEEQMARYLDRYFSQSERFHVLHDLKLEFEGDPAQIDHLVVHPFGVAIVESKSVSETVRVTPAGDWERQFRGRWQGMPDPLLQGERQGMVLKRLLQSREGELLDRFLLAMVQGTFTMMSVDVFAAISDHGRIQRARSGQAKNVVKADQVPGAIEAVVARHRRDGTLLSANLAAFAKAPRDFNKAERLRIARFLEVVDRRGRRQAVEPKVLPSGSTEPVVGRGSTGVAPPEAAVSVGTDGPAQLLCKSCGSADLELKSGQFGPYGRCRACGTNTGVKKRCACGGSIKSVVKGTGIESVCGQCGTVERAVVGAGA